MHKKILWLLVLIPPAIILYLITRYGITLPLIDQWDFAPLIIKAYHGQLTFSDLWAGYSNGRLILWKFVTINLALLTHWNIMIELWLSLACAVLTFFFLAKILSSSVSPKLFAPLLLIMSFLHFSVAQWESWGWGLATAYYISLLFIIISIWALHCLPSRRISLLATFLFGILATFTVNFGVLVWLPIGLGLILQRENIKRNLLIFFSVTTTLIFVYYNGMPPNEEATGLVFLKYPMVVFKFWLVWLSASLSFYNLDIAIWTSSLLLFLLVSSIIYLRITNKDELNKLRPWLLIAFYCICTDIVVAIVRSKYGEGYALSSRYTPFSTPFIISTVVISVSALNIYLKSFTKIPKEWIIAIASTVVLFIGLYSFSFADGRNKFIIRRSYVDLVAKQIQSGQYVDDQYLWILNGEHISKIRQLLKELQDIGYIHP